MVNVVAFIFPRFAENTYLVFDETRECLIIDPGCYTPKEKKQLSDYISYFHLQPKMLINTHCHVDHILGDKFILDTYGIPLALHEKEVRFLEVMPNYGRSRNLHIEPIPKTYHFLEEGDHVKVGKTSFEVLVTPGHSPGSISLYSEKEKILLSGDVLFKNRIGRVDLPGGDYDILMDTIHQKLFPLGDEVSVYPGHGATTTIGYEKVNNSYVCHWV